MKQYRGKENPQSKGHITITPLKSLAAKIYDGNIHLIRKENALRFFYSSQNTNKNNVNPILHSPDKNCYHLFFERNLVKFKEKERRSRNDWLGKVRSTCKVVVGGRNLKVACTKSTCPFI